MPLTVHYLAFIFNSYDIISYDVILGKKTIGILKANLFNQWILFGEKWVICIITTIVSINKTQMIYMWIFFSYEFNDSLCCCFSDVVLPISCLSFPCSAAKDCNSLLNVCNEWPTTSSLKRTPLLLLLLWWLDEDVVRRDPVVTCSCSYSVYIWENKIKNSMKMKTIYENQLLKEIHH